MSKWEVVMFRCLEAHVRVLTPITLHEHQRCLLLYKWNIYSMFMYKEPLCSHWPIRFNIWTLSILRAFFAYNCLEIWHTLHTPNARWLAWCGLHIFATRICGGAQLMSYSHLADLTSVMLIFQVHLIGHRSLQGNKTWHFFFLCITSVNCHTIRFQRLIHARLFPRNSSSPMFQDLILTSKLIHENCRTNIK